VTIASVVGSLFIDLYPRVLISSTSHAYNLTVTNAASGGYTLTVMSIVTALLLPVVLAYQAWSFWVMRQRIIAPVEGAEASASTPSASPTPPPAAPPAPAAG
jgi:cytochrome d ubiquinol oxidase subunit II